MISTPEDHGRTSWRSHLTGDLSGGLASAVIAVTGNVAAGVIAFAPLGPEYAGQAILAGMFTSVVAGLLAALLGRSPGMILGPKATTSMVFASLLGQLIAAGTFDLSAPEEVQVVLALAFTAVLVSGTAQLALGAFRVGVIVTFIPYPVIAGIRNTAALLLILSQIWPFLGMSSGPLWSLPVRLGEIQPATFIVAAATALIVARGAVLLPKAIVPGAALVAGALLHQGLGLLPFQLEMGPLLGALPSAFPTPAFAPDMLAALTSERTLRLLPIVLSGALAIAVLDSITSLISLVTFQSIAEKRFDPNRHLVGMGVGNMAVSVFGGLSASGILARSAVNHRAGGRTALSGVANSGWVLLLLILLAGPIGYVPKAALAGLIVVVAWGMFDEWSLTLAREALDRRRRKRQDLFVNLLQVGFVVAVGVVFNLIAAVGAGVLLSVFTFVVQMSRSPIRRVRRGSTVRSKRLREERANEILQAHGDRIGVVELEGTVFFGSSEAVARTIEELAEDGVDYLVVDLKRVRRVDASGYKVLGQMYARLEREGVNVMFSDVEADDDEIMQGLVLTGGVSPADCGMNTDHVLELFEDELLAELDAEAVLRERWEPVDFARYLGLGEDEHDVFAGSLKERSHYEGELVCARGEPGDSVFLLASGSADVSIPISRRGRSRRLATFTRGTIFGEMSLLDGRPRSADVRAREDVVLYELTNEAFDELARRHPGTAMKIFAAIGRILGERLRDANALIQELDS